MTITESQKRSVDCPKCGRRAGRPCVSSRIPGANTFGGGWGGPPDLDEAHRERREAFLKSRPDHCRACGMSLTDANAGKPDCPDTNNYEHDFPGHKLVVTITGVT